MGWSCRAEAGNTMNRWMEKCRLNSGSSNVWGDRRGWYMFEVSRVEHADGAITGAIVKFDGNPMRQESTPAKKVGSFRINPNGTVARAPGFLKRCGGGA